MLDHLLTRRVLIASIASLSFKSSGSTAKLLQYPINVGFGIEVRDVRLFPTPDVMRFLVEIYNTTDIAIDTPAVGVMLPNQSDAESFGWAVPISPVLHAHSAGGLIGVAPKGLTQDRELVDSQWTLCTHLNSRKADTLSPWDIRISHRTEVNHNEALKVLIRATNFGDSLNPTLRMAGLIRDKDHRICGATPLLYVPAIEPGMTHDLRIDIAPPDLAPVYNYLTNPFYLIDTVIDMGVTFSLQSFPSPVTPGCPALMPWNQ